MNRRVLLLGLDGATFRVLDPLMEAGEMPFLRSFLAEGARADLRSVIPALTPPAWTTLTTGSGPGRHGIFDFFQKESANGHAIGFATSRDILGQTIWEMASDQGLRSVALNFPVSFPPPPIDGYVVPGWMPWRQLRLGCRPSGLYDRIKALPGFSARELAMDMVQEEKALEGCHPDEYSEWIQMHIRREERWLQILEMILADDPCDLISLVLDGPDKLQHLFWRFLDPVYAHTVVEPWEQEVRRECLTYFRRLDQILARMVALVGDEALTLIVSDHGFGPQVRTFFANAWLAQRGYLAWAQEAPAPSSESTLGVGQIARHTYLLDWNRTRAYAPLPSGNGIHIVRQDADHPDGVPAEQYESFWRQLRSQLLTECDPETGEAVVAQVWHRDEIFAGPRVHLAPDLTLVLADGGLLSILDAEQAVQSRSQPSGTHHPLGIFAARGKGIRSGVRLNDLSLLDVAPLILHHMGITIPMQVENTPPVHIYNDVGSTSERRLGLETHRPALSDPVLRQSDITDPAPDARADVGARSTIDAEADTEAHSAIEMDEEAQEALLKRLRALGYVS